MININKRPRDYSTSVQSGGVHPHGPYNVPKRPRGAANARFANSIFNIPIQTQNSQIHQMTNNTASVPLLVRPWKKCWHTKYSPGSPIFVSRSDTGGRTPLHKIADIPTLNYMLLQGVNSANGVEGVFPKSDDTEGGLLSIYNFFGIYRNNLGKQMGSSRSQQTLINCDVYGRSKISNIFGTKRNLKRGTHVGLAIVSEPTGRLSSRGLIGDPSNITNTIPFETDSENVWQIYPTVNGALVDGDCLDGIIVHRIPLGVVSHAVSPVPSTKARNSARKVSGNMTDLPQIEILML